jgi:ATP-dependent Clp protease ATP-binding subunit ClpC
MSLELTEAACEYIAKEGTDVTFGARPLRRSIQRLLEDPISEGVLEGKWTGGNIIVADYDGEKIVFSQRVGEIPEARVRQNMAREPELITPVFSGRGETSGSPE